MINFVPSAAADSNVPMNRRPLFPREALIPFVLVTALFFFWGIPNNLNDVLIRQFMKSFAINRLQAGLVQFAFYLGYFCLSMPAAFIMRARGYKTGLIIGLVLYGAGSFLFWPAAYVQSYWFFLFALFVIASGLAFLETGAGAFIAQIGDQTTSELRLNFSQAFNPLGAITGALVGTVFIFSGIEPNQAQVAVMKASGAYAGYLRQETARVTTPYVILGCVVLLWALLLARTKFPKIGDEANQDSNTGHGSLAHLFRRPHFVQAVVAQFFYVGAQVSTWSYFIQYVQQYTLQPEKVAGYFLTGTLAAFAIGRFTATFLMRIIAPNKLMGIYSIVNIALVAVGVLFPGWVGLWAIFLTSFFMSLMFPTIFALGLKDLGPDTKLGGSLLVMSIIGGALFPLAMGYVSVATGSMALSMLVPMVSYFVVAYFSFVGCKIRPVRLAT